MNKFLYIFGYQTPHEFAVGDGESSEAFYVLAESEEDALKWGETISEEYVKRLFRDENTSWLKMDFARWIEKNPQSNFNESDLKKIPVLKCGEFPNRNEE